MSKEERVKLFLYELSQLTDKYGISIKAPDMMWANDEETDKLLSYFEFNSYTGDYVKK